MSKPNDTSPATKSDIKLLMDELGKLYDATERWKDELADKTQRWQLLSVTETKQHFDLTVEQIRHDLLAANREQIELLRDRADGHENRITRLEQHAGYVVG
jgi:hypothetical protein